MLLSQLLREYALERDLSAGWVEQLNIAVGLFGRFLAREARLNDLAPTPVNAWLLWLIESRKSQRRTVKNKRDALLTLWRAAYEDGLTELPPLRVRRVKVPQSIPTAWDLDELGRALRSARQLGGAFRRSRMPRNRVMPGWILAGWWTGLRFADVYQLRWDAFDLRWRGVIRQSKSGKPQPIMLHPDAVEAIEPLRAYGSQFIFRDLACRDGYIDAFRELLEAVGLTGGSQKLRRSAGTWADVENPGRGHEHLGNTPAIFAKSYRDPRFFTQDRPMPPRIA